MNPPGFVPVLPDSAPFTPEQRAYLNGFFAGLFSRTSAGGAPSPAPAARPLQPLTVLFGSQTGTAERLAKRIAREAGQRGFAATIHDLSAYPVSRLATEQSVLVVTSTYGDGEPPDNARAFWEYVSGPSAPALAGMNFSVCALGDSNYPRFCAFGRSVDEQLAKLGARCAHPRVDCDLEFEAPFVAWLGAALGKLAGGAPPTATVESGPVRTSIASGPLTHSGPDRKNPCPAPLVTNRRLNAEGSAKDTRHFEFSVDGTGLVYTAGDALGVYPANCPELAAELVQALGCTGDELVPGPDAGAPEISLLEALINQYDITRIQPSLIKALAEITKVEQLEKLSAPDVNGKLTEFVRGREVIDLLLTYPQARFDPVTFVTLLKKLQPRLYSISSSPAAHAGQVHLCVGVVRYESLGRQRKGVCSTFLAERVSSSQPVRVFHHANSNFRLPAAPETPMVMVGPGTGIAPFRGFLHERRAVGATGRHWLFFGDQRGATDFLFRDELEAFRKDGHLARLDTAFSRDQAGKVYVQDRMLEQAAELFAWLEAGAHFYVCGDASRMAKDVDAALHQVVRIAGGKTENQALDYVKALKASKRYQRDVY